MNLLKHEYLDDATWREDANLANVTGTPLVSAVANYESSILADTYTLAFSSVVASSSATVSVATLSPHNPRSGVTRSVLLNNTTAHKDVIPGLSIIFSNSGSFTNSWTATIKVGQYAGARTGDGQVFQETRHRVTNLSAVGVAQAQVVFYPQMLRVASQGAFGRVFAYLSPASLSAIVKSDSTGRVMPYVASVANVASGRADLLIDGLLLPSILNLSSGDTTTSAALLANNTTQYKVNSGALAGVIFSLDSGVVNGAKENLMVFGSRYIEAARETSPSVAGEYSTGALTLTEQGQSAGLITPAGIAYFWTRLRLEAGANSHSNPYPCNLALTGLITV